MESKNLDKKKLIIAIAAVVVIAIVATVLILLAGGKYRATTMRLLRMEGTVNLEENGKSKTVIDNLRLKSGNAINTESASLASIGLDETKIVTMDELSRAEFSQKGKKLDLNLTKGSLFFEVKKPLEDDESFDIRTATMIVGIRGTSGYVTVDSDGNWNIVVTDGKVHVTGTNPNTGEVKEIDVEAGQRCTVYLYDRDKDSVMFTLDEVTEDEIPDFVVTIFRDEPELLDKVVSDTNWSKPVILGIEKAEEKPDTVEELNE
ncbi:MAG: FecR domain-containing protein, partial [Lachnospiraceae bacterium]|nr:FecR domain-containing protein [Lachnospiraceae bacterium]